jgi:2-dehydro-3-deoxygluconokinase
MSPDDLDEDYIKGAQVLHLTGITPALSATCRAASFAAAEIARGAGVQVVLDPNLRLKLWSADEARTVLRDLARHADVLLPGADEAEMLSGESDPEAAAGALLRLGPRQVVVKIGASGCLAVSDDEVLHVPAMALPRVVDPVGAGDAFAAGFHVGRLRGFSLVETLQLANRCGGLAVTVAGDIEGLPRWEEAANVTDADVRR